MKAARAMRAALIRVWNSLRALRSVVAAEQTSSHRDEDLRAELEAHLEMHVAENIRRGMTPEDARRDALLVAGGLTLAAEAVRERRGLPIVEEIATDLRYALRGLRNKPTFAAAMVLTLALGIGANSAMFSIVNAVVVRPLPYPDADRLVSIALRRTADGRQAVDDHNYVAWLTSAKSVTLAVMSSTSAVFALPGGEQTFRGERVTKNYFAIFGVQPLVGRTFTDDELRDPALHSILIGEQMWRTAFGGDPAIVGTSITVDGNPAAIVGVMPASFHEASAEWWRPYFTRPPRPRASFLYMPVGRLNRGYTIDMARAELSAITARVQAEKPAAERDVRPIVMTLHERRYGERRKPLLLLFAAVGVLLAIACANLASLTLARATSRQREIAVRLALGAGRWRLVRGLLCESLLLSLAGAMIGLLIARVAVAYAIHLSPQSVGNIEDIGIDMPVLVFTLVVAVATSAAFGLVPALAASRRDVHAALTVAGPRATSSAARQLTRRVLAIAQLATALVLLTGAGLVARTFWRVATIDTGFRSDGLTQVMIRLPSARYANGRAGVFFHALFDRVRAIPGVTSATIADSPPLVGFLRISFASLDLNGDSIPRIDVVAAAPDYFATIGAAIRSGRDFTTGDREGTLPVAVINESLARRMFGRSDVAGRTISYVDGKQLTVVGVAKDIHERGLEDHGDPTVYVPIEQDGIETAEAILVRTTTDAAALAPVIGAMMRSLDPALPPPELEPVNAILARELAPRRFTFLLLGAFAGLAALLAVIGLYGVLVDAVTERTREIGIRVALGADPSRVTRLVLRQGAVLALVGAAIGLGASTVTVRLTRSMLYETSVYDPWTFAGGTVLLVSVCLAAAYIPARRASRVDPTLALRAE